MSRSARRRGQAVTEVSLGLLLLVPVLLGAIYLAEASIFRLEATEAATEPLWDATAYQQNSYTGAFDRTPGAAGAASGNANARMRSRTMVFTRADPARVSCTIGGTPLGLSISSTSNVYADNGGMSCTSRLTVDPKGLTRFLLDQGGRDSFFKEPLANMQRQFDFCQTEKCLPFQMAIGDWGLTNRNQEDAECALTMSGCANQGFFDFSQRVYERYRTGGGTRGRQYLRFVEGMVGTPPNGLTNLLDFQMSFRGEESNFTQRVPVSEGEPEWKTSPGSVGAWAASYGGRTPRFLGLP